MATNEILHKAIQKINPNAEVLISNGDIDNLVWLNNTTPISKSKIEEQISIVENEIELEKQNTEIKKTSGKQKLKDLGLDDDEIQALLGV